MAERQQCEFSGLERGTHDGVLVVIDVIRAFTTAAVAFEAGVEKIICVEDLDEARDLRSIIDGSRLMGEERGQKPEGFDFGNSPRDLDDTDLRGVTMVQRTSNGTRGLAWVQSPVVLAASAVNASATVAYVRRLHPGAAVRFVATGKTGEDMACADYMAALIEGQTPDPSQLRDAIVAFGNDHVAGWVSERDTPAFQAFLADVSRCAEVDRYDFAMVGERADRQVILTAARPTTSA